MVKCIRIISLGGIVGIVTRYYVFLSFFEECLRKSIKMYDSVTFHIRIDEQTSTHDALKDALKSFPPFFYLSI